MLTPSTLRPRPPQGAFVPLRLARGLLRLVDDLDLDMAVRLRGSIRKAVNAGRPEDASRFAATAAELVRRRAKGIAP